MPEADQEREAMRAEIARLRVSERRLQAAVDQGDRLRILASADGTILERSLTAIART